MTFVELFCCFSLIFNHYYHSRSSSPNNHHHNSRHNNHNKHHNEKPKKVLVTDLGGKNVWFYGVFVLVVILFMWFNVLYYSAVVYFWSICGQNFHNKLKICNCCGVFTHDWVMNSFCFYVISHIFMFRQPHRNEFSSSGEKNGAHERRYF